MVRLVIGLIGTLFLLSANGCSTATNTAETPAQVSGVQIKGKCLVRNYGEGESLYVTKNEHLFYPKSLYFEIISNEPQGKKTWTLSYNHFSASGNSKMDKTELYTKELMQAVFFSMSAATERLSGLNLTAGEPIKVEGKWYIPYRYMMGSTSIELLQNHSTQRYELVIIKSDNTQLQVYSYNLWYDPFLDRQIPRTIDIFDISQGLASKQLRMQVQYTFIAASRR